LPTTVADETSSFLCRCDKSLKHLIISYEETDHMTGDLIVNPYDLTRFFEEGDEGYQEVVRNAHYWCRLGTADYSVSIAPHIFNGRVSGPCGAAPPSISVTITRNGKRIASDITFESYCNDRNIIDAVRVDEPAKSITLISGLAVFERHIEKEYPLDAFPQDWYSEFFDKNGRRVMRLQTYDTA
jgi:hypothetical protein